MKTLGAIVLVLAIVAGVGFYRGWFQVASNNEDANSQITLTVDKDKIQDDREAATEKVEDLGHDAKEMVAGEDGEDSAATPNLENKDAKVNADEAS